MPYKIVHIENLNIVEVMYYGIVTSDDVNNASTESQAMQVEKGSILLLVNSSKIDMTTANIMDVHLIPEKLYSKNDSIRKKVIAVVDSEVPSVKSILNDYCNACFNRGWKIKRFDSRDNAVEWLLM